MKYFTGLSVLKYSWDQVATGFWSRYPNPYRYRNSVLLCLYSECFLV